MMIQSIMLNEISLKNSSLVIISYKHNGHDLSVCGKCKLSQVNCFSILTNPVLTTLLINPPQYFRLRHEFTYNINGAILYTCSGKRKSKSVTESNA